MTTQQLYSEMLDDYTTSKSKKAFLTRCKKQCKEHLTELENGADWLHGERITPMRVSKVRTEIKIIDRLYKLL